MIRGLFDSSGNSHFARARRILLVCICIMVVTFQLWGSLGLRLNTSPSLPVGLYRTTSDPAANLVEFCPAEPFAHLAIARGYRSAGNCPDGAAPLLKPVVAKPGDIVEVSARGIVVNGRSIPNTAPIAADTKGRPLLPWPKGRYVAKPGTVWVASSFHVRSFDSRYFGPVSANAIRDRVTPVLTGGK